VAQFDSDKFIKLLNEKWGGRKCPMCGGGPWNVQDSPFQLMKFNEGKIVVGGPLIPVIPVSCRNCGNTVLVNAIIAGVVEPDNKPEKAESEQGNTEQGETS